jgi:hypothetical protein
MSRTSLAIVFTLLCASGCGGTRLSHSEIRRQIAEVGGSTLVPSSVNISRVVSQSGNRLIAETTVELAVQFERTAEDSPWRIVAVRLGDQNWMSMPELIAALNEGRRRETVTALEKLAGGITAYRQRNNGTVPAAANIVLLTDVLHPQYMTELVRLDAWGNAIQYQAKGAAFELRSFGADEKPGTSDDVLIQGPTP